MAKKVIKEEENKKIEAEAPIKLGMSDTTKGLIIGVAVAGMVAALVILLIVGQNNKDEKSNDVSNENYSSSSNSTNNDDNDNNDASNSSGNNSTNSSNSEGESDALKEFYNYFESKEKTLIVFASTSCSYCLMQEPIVHAIGEKYDLNYLYMDYLELNGNDEVYQIIDELGIEGSTPTSVIVQNGKVITSWEGYVEGKTYVSNLIKAGLLDDSASYDFEDNITSIDYSRFKELLEGSKVSAVIVDMPTCGLCTTERFALNDLAEEYEVNVYQLSADNMSEDDIDEFIDSLGKWGYDDPGYEENQDVEVPLLLFVKNGKIVDYNLGYVEGETDLVKLFKDAGVIKK